MYKISVADLDRLMRKQGKPQFNYDVFKTAYDSDTRLQNLIKDFNEKQVTLKRDENDDLEVSDKKHKKDKSKENVRKMASRAVDLGD